MGEPFRPASRDGNGLAEWFAQADRNHDGQLTLDEMQADADRFFALLDVNHDGEIDPDEIDALRNRDRAGNLERRSFRDGGDGHRRTRGWRWRSRRTATAAIAVVTATMAAVATEVMAAAIIRWRSFFPPPGQ